MKRCWRYAIEGFFALALLGICAHFVRVYGSQITDRTLHAIVVLLPVVPIALFGIAGLRLYRALDELQRRQILVGIAGGVWLSQLVLMAYRFMPNAGLPPPPPGTPVVILCIFFVIVILALRDSLFDMRKPK